MSDESTIDLRQAPTRAETEERWRKIMAQKLEPGRMWMTPTELAAFRRDVQASMDPGVEGSQRERAAVLALARGPGEHCPNCGAALEQRKCKQTCTRCGFFQDCSTGPA